MSGIAGEGCEILVPFNERKPLSDIERSLVKTYRKKVWSKFVKAVIDYKLNSIIERLDNIKSVVFHMFFSLIFLLS